MKDEGWSSALTSLLTDFKVVNSFQIITFFAFSHEFNNQKLVLSSINMIRLFMKIARLYSRILIHFTAFNPGIYDCFIMVQ